MEGVYSAMAVMFAHGMSFIDVLAFIIILRFTYIRLQVSELLFISSIRLHSFRNIAKFERE